MKAMSSPGQVEVEQDGLSEIPATAGAAAFGQASGTAPLYQGHRKKGTTNFNKNKIKMIKPFISFRDYLFAAGWSKQS